MRMKMSRILTFDKVSQTTIGKKMLELEIQKQFGEPIFFAQYILVEMQKEPKDREF